MAEAPDRRAEAKKVLVEAVIVAVGGCLGIRCKQRFTLGLALTRNYFPDGNQRLSPNANEYRVSACRCWNKSLYTFHQPVRRCQNEREAPAIGLCD